MQNRAEDCDPGKSVEHDIHSIKKCVSQTSIQLWTKDTILSKFKDRYSNILMMQISDIFCFEVFQKLLARGFLDSNLIKA